MLQETAPEPHELGRKPRATLAVNITEEDSELAG